MHHVARIAVVGQIGAAQLERGIGQARIVGNAGVRLGAGERRLCRVELAILETGGARREEMQIILPDPLGKLGQHTGRKGFGVEGRCRIDRIILELSECLGLRRRAARLRGRQKRISGFVGIDQRVRADEIGNRIDGLDLELLGQSPVGPWRAIRVDNTPRQQVPNVLATFRHIGGIKIVEGAVLADHHDQMLDGRDGLGTFALACRQFGPSRTAGQHSAQSTRNKTAGRSIPPAISD